MTQHFEQTDNNYLMILFYLEEEMDYALLICAKTIDQDNMPIITAKFDSPTNNRFFWQQVQILLLYYLYIIDQGIEPVPITVIKKFSWWAPSSNYFDSAPWVLERIRNFTENQQFRPLPLNIHLARRRALSMSKSLTSTNSNIQIGSSPAVLSSLSATQNSSSSSTTEVSSPPLNQYIDFRIFIDKLINNPEEWQSFVNQFPPEHQIHLFFKKYIAVNPMPLQKNDVLSTVGDGNCAFHAVLGTMINGLIRCKNIPAERAAVAEYIRQHNGDFTIRKYICAVISDSVMVSDVFAQQKMWRLSQRYLEYQQGSDSGAAWKRFYDILIQDKTNILDKIDLCHRVPTSQLKKETLHTRIILLKFSDALNRGLRENIAADETLSKAFEQYNQETGSNFNWEEEIQPDDISYLAEHIGTPGKWVIGEAFGLIAHAYSITVHYYSAPKANPVTYNAGQNEQISVQHDGDKHYERILPQRRKMEISGIIAEIGMFGEKSGVKVSKIINEYEGNDASITHQLFTVAVQGNITEIDGLLAQQANLLAIGTNGTALHIAAAAGYLECVEHLISKGADVFAKHQNWRASGWAAQQLGHEHPVVQSLRKHEWEQSKSALNAEKLSFLLEQGADLSITDLEGNSMAHYAIEVNNLSALQLLYRHFPTVATAFQNKQSLTHAASAAKRYPPEHRINLFLQSATVLLASLNLKGVDVANDEHCLFWSAALGLLLAKLEHKELFKAMYLRLFGRGSIKRSCIKSLFSN